LGDHKQITLNPVFNGSDPFLEQIAVSMRGALNDNSLASKLYVDGLHARAVSALHLKTH
jgi:hypothetical protein